MHPCGNPLIPQILWNEKKKCCCIFCNQHFRDYRALSFHWKSCSKMGPDSILVAKQVCFLLNYMVGCRLTPPREQVGPDGEPVPRTYSDLRARILEIKLDDAVNVALATAVREAVVPEPGEGPNPEGHIGGPGPGGPPGGPGGDQPGQGGGGSRGGPSRDGRGGRGGGGGAGSSGGSGSGGAGPSSDRGGDSGHRGAGRRGGGGERPSGGSVWGVAGPSSDRDGVVRRGALRSALRRRSGEGEGGPARPKRARRDRDGADTNAGRAEGRKKKPEAPVLPPPLPVPVAGGAAGPAALGVLPPQGSFTTFDCVANRTRGKRGQSVCEFLELPAPKRRCVSAAQVVAPPPPVAAVAEEVVVVEEGNLEDDQVVDPAQPVVKEEVDSAEDEEPVVMEDVYPQPYHQPLAPQPPPNQPQPHPLAVLIADEWGEEDEPEAGPAHADPLPTLALSPEQGLVLGDPLAAPPSPQPSVSGGSPSGGPTAIDLPPPGADSFVVAAGSQDPGPGYTTNDPGDSWHAPDQTTTQIEWDRKNRNQYMHSN